eukprot:CAMPEP_0170745006 /NCGR_PEP_ID=MMETSP0437-20130122/8074_1 /TAXON_ID=0 /ORGANISM="Sexangularia sp." /LENGTH=632 /DNA_ID=CAMNT_0011083719 /DNA_START=720 /DNA_END=2618 /DNA_ORIENTATION=+
MLNAAFQGMVTGDPAQPDATQPFVGRGGPVRATAGALSVSPMTYGMANNGVLLIQLFLLCLLVPVSFLPQLVRKGVAEGQSKSFHMLRLVGVSNTAYVFSSVLADTLTIWFALLVVVVVSAVTRLHWLVRVSPWVPVIMFASTPSIVALALVLAGPFSSETSAQRWTWLVVLVGAPTLAYSVGFIHGCGTAPPFLLAMVPTQSLLQAIFIALNNFMNAGIIPSLVPSSTHLYPLLLVESLLSGLLWLALALLSTYTQGSSLTLSGWMYTVRSWMYERVRSHRPHNELLINTGDTFDGDQGESGEGGRAVDPSVDLERERALAAQQTAANVVVRDVVKSYRPGMEPALKGVSFVASGEIFGILGPNGSGKTTLFDCLTGMHQATSGTVWTGVGHRVGYVPQFDVLYPDLTVQQQVLFFARLIGVSPSTEAVIVQETLELCGLATMASKKPASLSPGYRRRVSLAIALVGNPRVVCLDELTADTDQSAQKALWKLISAIRKDRTIIMSSHSMTEVDVLCDRVGFMIDGRLVRVGTPSELKSTMGKDIRVRAEWAQAVEAEDVFNFVEGLLPIAAVRETTTETSATWRVSNKMDLCISKLVARMELHGASKGIKSWGMTQPDLNDVFLATVEAYQ